MNSFAFAARRQFVKSYFADGFYPQIWRAASLSDPSLFRAIALLGLSGAGLFVFKGFGIPPLDVPLATLCAFVAIGCAAYAGWIPTSKLSWMLLGGLMVVFLVVLGWKARQKRSIA